MHACFLGVGFFLTNNFAVYSNTRTVLNNYYLKLIII